MDINSTVFDLTTDDLTEANYKSFSGSRELEHQIGRLRNTESIFRMIKENNMPGDFIEFGVYQGAFLIWLARFRKKYGLSDRKIIGVDCFSGLPSSSGPWAYGTFNDTSVDLVKQNIEKHLSADEQSNIFVVDGLFSDTVVKNKISDITGSICLAHIDCDLGSSANDALGLLDPYLSGTQFLLFDDWFISENEIPASFAGWQSSHPNVCATEMASTNLTKYFRLSRSDE